MLYQGGQDRVEAVFAKVEEETGTVLPRRVPENALISPPATGSVPGSNRSSLPISPAHTPKWSNLPAPPEKNGPVSPYT